MRRVISSLLVFCLFTAPLRANLGETVQQCVARYGRPNGYSEAGPKSPFGTLVFISGGLVLTLFIYDNKEVGARISKSDKSAFSTADLQVIMDTDTAGSRWASVKSNDPADFAWQRGDNANVIYDQVKRMVIFTSPAMSDALQAASARPTPSSPPPSNAAKTSAATAN